MLPCIVNLLERFRQDWTAHLKPEAILDACRQAGYTWRERTLDPVTTIQLFLLQVLGPVENFVSVGRMDVFPDSLIYGD